MLELYYHQLTLLINEPEIKGNVASILLKIFSSHKLLDKYKWDILNILLKIEMNDVFI